jgi:tetratricopeptide (TPR) repeat protein
VAGKELGVDAVLISWMNQRGDTLFISAELVNTTDSSLIWSHQYKQKGSELLAIQQDIIKSILDSLRVELKPEQQARVSQQRPVNPDAYDAYLKAVYFRRNWTTAEDAFRVFDYCEKAIKLDPTYVPAYTLLAHWHEETGRLALRSSYESFPKAREFALKALKIDEKSSFAHAILATVKLFYDWDLKGAQESIERALEFDPENSNSDVLLHYTFLLEAVGQYDKYVSITKRQIELDPFFDVWKCNYVLSCFLAGRYEESISQAKKFLENREMMRNWILSTIHNTLALNYIKKKMHSEAMAECDMALDLLGSIPDYFTLSLIGYTYGILGRRDKAMEILQRIDTESPPTQIPIHKDSTYFALLYSGLEDKDKAFAWLEKAYEEHSSLLIWLKSMPFYDNLHSDHRYEALLKKMGLEE